MARKITKFPRDAKSSVREYVRAKPWHKSPRMKTVLVTRLLRDLAWVYGCAVPSYRLAPRMKRELGRIYVVPIRDGPGVLDIDVCYHIETANVSLITLLHEFRHVLQQERDDIAERAAEVGAEEDAQEWALMLIKHTNARWYENYLKTGKLVGGRSP